MTSSRARAAFLVLLLFAASGCAARTAGPRQGGPHQETAGPLKGGPHITALRGELDRVFNAPIMARGVWGVDIRSLQTGERLYELNARRLMMPASNMKIVTLATAVEMLGWDFRYTTTLETAGTIDDGGVLQGDLFVRGSGDPTVNSRGGRAEALLTEWANALRATGIREIRGRVIGDDQAFDEEGIGPGWSWDYLEAGYAAPSGALQFNENIASLTVTPAAVSGEAPAVALEPGTGLTVFSRATTGDAGSRETLQYRRRIDGPILEISGSVPARATPLRRAVAVANPTLFFAQSLRDALISRDITVAGAAADFDDVSGEFVAARERRVLVSSQSPPLREIAIVLMKVSQNLYAETFLKTLGAADGSLGTTPGGRAAARRTLAAWSISDDSYVMADGSGLSRYNYLAPEMIVAVLERMHRDERHRDAFVATLPIAGKDGTISTRMRRTRAEGNAVAKTGSIANVRSLSGYVKTRDGEPLVFSIIANDFIIPAATVSYIADLAVEILSNFSRQ
jgi:D-alanyl-D-alanine carboxypeptidase/D-alanyl-D-alanine-endopeptidase (penicillin-binding protein 4)